MAKQKQHDSSDSTDATMNANMPKSQLERINDHAEKLSGLKDAKTAIKEDGTASNAKPADLSSEDGYEAYAHKMANVTRADLILAMQNGGKAGLDLLTAKWDLEDHGDRFDDENAIPFAQRASQGKAQTVQGARHADVVAARQSETHVGAGTATGKAHASDKPYP